MHLLGAALTNLHVNLPYRLGHGSCKPYLLPVPGATDEDTEGIVSTLVNIAGVEAGVLLRELPGGAEFRVSLRSKTTLDVARVAETFGGGGHRNASGCTLPGPLADATSRILTSFAHKLC